MTVALLQVDARALDFACRGVELDSAAHSPAGNAYALEPIEHALISEARTGSELRARLHVAVYG